MNIVRTSSLFLIERRNGRGHGVGSATVDVYRLGQRKALSLSPAIEQVPLGPTPCLVVHSLTLEFWPANMKATVKPAGKAAASPRFHGCAQEFAE